MVKSQKIEKIPYFYLFLTAIAFVILLLTLYPYKPDLSKLSAFPTPTPTPTVPKYICPTSEWVDCMPGPGPLKTQCQPDYLNWAKINCPNFEGAAL